MPTRHKTEGGWMGTSPTGVSIIFHRDVDVSDRFPFVDLRDLEIRRAFVHIDALHEMAVVDHVTMNMVNGGDGSEEDEHFGSANRDDHFLHATNLCTEEQDTDMTQHTGAVSLINTLYKQFEGLTPREAKQAILAKTVQL